MLENISNLRNLNSLALFLNGIELNKKSLKEFGFFFVKLKKLTSLTLRLNECKLRQEDAEILSKLILCFRELNNLSL